MSQFDDALAFAQAIHNSIYGIDQSAEANKSRREEILDEIDRGMEQLPRAGDEPASDMGQGVGGFRAKAKSPKGKPGLDRDLDLREYILEQLSEIDERREEIADELALMHGEEDCLRKLADEFGVALD